MEKADGQPYEIVAISRRKAPAEPGRFLQKRFVVPPPGQGVRAGDLFRLRYRNIRLRHRILHGGFGCGFARTTVSRHSTWTQLHLGGVDETGFRNRRSGMSALPRAHANRGCDSSSRRHSENFGLPRAALACATYRNIRLSTPSPTRIVHTGKTPAPHSCVFPVRD